MDQNCQKCCKIMWNFPQFSSLKYVNDLIYHNNNWQLVVQNSGCIFCHLWTFIGKKCLGYLSLAGDAIRCINVFSHISAIMVEFGPLDIRDTIATIIDRGWATTVILFFTINWPYQNLWETLQFATPLSDSQSLEHSEGTWNKVVKMCKSQSFSALYG